MSGRCKSCNVILFDEELTNKYPGTNEYVELCNKCLDIALNPDSAFDDYGTVTTEYHE
jgi:hypothetical protein